MKAILTEALAQDATKKTAGVTASDLPSPKDLLEVVEQSLEDDKAESIVSIDLSGRSSMADYMVIASGRSSRQVAAISEHLQQNLKKAGLKSISLEGVGQGDWVLVDAGDIIIHIFRPEVREFYALEKMWGHEAETSEQDSSGEAKRLQV